MGAQLAPASGRPEWILKVLEARRSLQKSKVVIFEISKKVVFEQRFPMLGCMPWPSRIFPESREHLKSKPRGSYTTPKYQKAISLIETISFSSNKKFCHRIKWLQSEPKLQLHANYSSRRSKLLLHESCRDPWEGQKPLLR